MAIVVPIAVLLAAVAALATLMIRKKQRDQRKKAANAGLLKVGRQGGVFMKGLMLMLLACDVMPSVWAVYLKSLCSERVLRLLLWNLLQYAHFTDVKGMPDVQDGPPSSLQGTKSRSLPTGYSGDVESNQMG